MPDAGTYRVCSATPGEHTLEPKDLVVVGKFDVITEVKLDAESPDEVTLEMFPGARGLIGRSGFKHKGKMLAHIVTMAKSSERPVDCKLRNVVRIAFMWQDRSGKWTESTSDPDGAHVHVEN